MNNSTMAASARAQTTRQRKAGLSFLTACVLGLASSALPAAATTYDFTTAFEIVDYDTATSSGTYQDLLITVMDNDPEYPIPYAYTFTPSGILFFGGVGWSYSSANVLLTLAKTNGSSFTPNSVRLVYNTYSPYGDPGTFESGTIKVTAFSGATPVGTWTNYYNGSGNSSGLTLDLDFSLLNSFHNITSLQFDNDRQNLALQNLVMDGAANTTPTFVGSTTTLSVNQSAGAASVTPLLHVSDTDASQTLTWSQFSAPTHGTLSIANATADSGSDDIAPGGTITYTPADGYSGSDSFVVGVSDGTTNSTRTVSVNVVDDIAPVITSAASATGTNGTGFSYLITASGGATFFGATGLPPGLTIASETGLISGTPHHAGTFGATITAADPAGNIATNSVTLTITGAPLTITANNTNKVYGAAVPTLTASYSGFVNGDTSASLTTAPTLSTTATVNSYRGTYPTTASGAVDSDYTISYVAGTLDVTGASLIVTANNTNKVYGAALPLFTGTVTGVTSNDAQAGFTVTFGTVANASSHVGTYGILPAFSDSSLQANYNVTTNQGTLSVTAAALTVKADNKTFAYGLSNPVFTASYLGLTNNDTSAAFTTVPTVGIAANISAGLTNKFGTYTITASGGSAPDYSLSYATGILTVTKAPLTIIVAGTNRPYGQPNPVLISSVVGSVGSDNLSISPTATATQSSPPGTYTINVPINDPKGKLGWYSQIYQVGTLIVTPAPLVGTVQNQTRAYGQTNSPFAVTYTGWALGQDNTLLTGSLLVTCVDTNGLTVGSNSVVGSYPIQAGGQSAANYSVSYQDGSLTVTQAVLNVAANNVHRTYGDINPAFASTITGFVNGETTSNLGGSLSLTTVAGTNSHVGNYDINASGYTSSNYQIVFTKGTLTVDTAALTVTTTGATKVYGAALPELSGSVSGVRNNERLSATFHTAATSSSPVASYPVYPVFADLDNTLANYLLRFA